MRSIDLDLMLRDALDDPEVPTVRRLLAGQSIGTGLDDAYYSACELRIAVETLAADHACGIDPEESLGADMVDHILQARGDDYSAGSTSRCRR